jgi:hypothetical protein
MILRTVLLRSRLGGSRRVTRDSGVSELECLQKGLMLRVPRRGGNVVKQLLCHGQVAAKCLRDSPLSYRLWALISRTQAYSQPLSLLAGIAARIPPLSQLGPWATKSCRIAARPPLTARPKLAFVRSFPFFSRTATITCHDLTSPLHPTSAPNRICPSGVTSQSASILIISFAYSATIHE